MTVPTISVQGKQFVSGSPAQRFMVRGIALSANAVLNSKLSGIQDILADEHADFMLNDVIPQLVYLGVNTVRVYQVDPNNTHAKTMNNLAANGIYAMVGLATSYNSVNQMSGDYTQSTFVHAARVVDEFQAYSNTLCFSVGNEVEFPGQMASNLMTANPTWTASQVVAATVTLEYAVAKSIKSFARDIKSHISTNSYRTIPVGVAMQDGPQSSWGSTNPNDYQQGLLGTDTIAQFYTSGSQEEITDFIGINSYRYVSGSGQQDVAYSGLVREASLYPVPVFLTETGGLPTPNAARDWLDVPTLYSSTLNYYQQLSGQVAFQMMDEGAGYGIYLVNADNSLSSQFTDGAADLSAQFVAVSTLTVGAAKTTPPIPTTAPTSVTPPGMSPITLSWPSLHSLKSYSVPNATATVVNYSTNSILLLQQGGEIGMVAGATSTTAPNTATIAVFAGAEIAVLGNTGTASAPTWVALCSVPASAVVDGVVIGTNVSWGSSQQCMLPGNLVAITVNNYSNVAINVVQNNVVMGVVAPTTNSNTPVVATVAVTPQVAILLQGPAPGYDACCQVAAAQVVAGMSISNNVAWGSGVVCNVSPPTNN